MVNKLSKKLFAPRIGVRYVAAFSDTPYLFCARTSRRAAHIGFTYQLFKEPLCRSSLSNQKRGKGRQFIYKKLTYK